MPDNVARGPRPFVQADETWSGVVRAAGSIIVAPGATLTLAEGTRLTLPPGAVLQARGRLVAAGSADAPVVIEAEAVGIVDGGTALLRHARLIGLKGQGLLLRGEAGADCSDLSVSAGGEFAINHRSTGALRLVRCAVEGGRIGLSAAAGPLEASDLRLSKQGALALELSCEAALERVWAQGAGIRVVGGRARASELSVRAAACVEVVGSAALDWSAGSCEASETGLRVAGGEAVVRGVAFRGGARAVSVESGRAVVAGSKLSGLSVACVSVAAGASAALTDCELSGAPTGVGCSGELSVLRCEFSGHEAQALDLQGRGQRVTASRARARGFSAVVAGEAAFEDFEAASSGHAVVLREGAKVSWTGGAAESSDAAIHASQAELSLARVKVTGAKGGVLMRGGRLAAEACEFRGGAGAALELAGGEHRISSSSASDCETGLLVSGGACRGEALTLSGTRTCAEARADARLFLSSSSLRGGAIGTKLEAGSLEARDVAFEGQSELSLELAGPARLERVSARSSALGLKVVGGETSAAGLTLACRDGAQVVGEGRLAWSGGSCAASGLGLEVLGGSAVVRGVAFSGGARGTSLEGGSLDAEGSSWTEHESEAIFCETGDVLLRDCAVEGAERGLVAHGGKLTAADVRFTGQRELSLELSCSARLERVSASSGALALKVVGGATEAHELTLRAPRGAAVVGACRLHWSGGACVAEDLGLAIAGGRVELAGVRFDGGERGASVEGGALAAEDVSWAGQTLASVSVAADASASFDACAFSGSPTAASARGPVSLKRCRLSGHAAQGLDLHGGGHLVEDCSLDDCGVAVVLEGEARFFAVSARGARHAVSLGDRARLDWRGGSARASGVALLLGGGCASLEDVSCGGGQGGALVEAGRLSASRCSFEGGGPALELSGGEMDLSDVSARDCETGLVVAGGACRARGLELSGRAEGLAVREGGSLDWSGGACSGRRGLSVSGGHAVVDDAACRGRAEAVRLEAGSLRARGLRAGGGSECGVFVDGGAFCEWSGGSIERSPIGLAARDGHVHLLDAPSFEGCARAVAVEPGAELCLRRVWDAGRAPSRALLDFVLATKDGFAWRGLYWLAYAGGAAWLRLRLASERGIAAARLHRGWRTGDWQPGVSDLDALAVARDLSGEDGARRVARLWRRYGSWKRLLPFLGEILLAERPEVDAFVRTGGARAAAVARTLGLDAPPPGGRADDLVECAHAYTRLLQCAFSPGEPWARNARNAEKSLLDVLRHGPLREPGSPLLSRVEAAARTRSTALAALRASEPADQALAFSRAAAEALSALDAAFSLKSEGAAEPVFARGASEALDELYACFGPAMTGALTDELYRSYVVLDARGSQPEELSPALAAAARRRPLIPGTLPVPLTGGLWRALARSPYLEDPTRGLGFGASKTLDAGRLFPGVSQAAWGECLVPAPSEALRAAARPAAANFALTWRWLGAGGGNPRVVFHYLISRALGLRLLLERGEAVPFFSLDPLLERCAGEFPELARPLGALRPPREDATLEETFRSIYPLVDAQVRRLVERLRVS